MSIVFLSSDTPHHRYFINTLIKQGVIPQKIYFETKHINPGFEVGPFFSMEETQFERKFFETIDYKIKSPTSYVESVNDVCVIKELAEIKPDLGIVFGTGRINKPAIELFGNGLVNVHRGIVQRYRGVDSDLWAVYHNDFSNIGVTIHKVSERLDTGGIVRQDFLNITKDMEIFQLRYYTTLIATELMVDILKEYLRSGNIYNCNQNELGRYYSFMPLVLKNVVAKKFKKYIEGL